MFRALPDTWRAGRGAGVLVLRALAALYPLRFFRPPRDDEIDRRIETANLLVHTPVRVQTDRPAGDAAAFGQALWREHQSRMAARLAGVGADLPRTAVPERDPWALRAVAALLLVTAFAYSLGSGGGNIGDLFRQVSLRARCRRVSMPG